MACRVGTSKFPYTRIDYWKKKEGHTHGEVLHETLTYDAAARAETVEAITRGCHHALGGDPGDDRNKRVWSVYLVSGGTIG